MFSWLICFNSFRPALRAEKFSWNWFNFRFIFFTSFSKDLCSIINFLRSLLESKRFFTVPILSLILSFSLIWLFNSLVKLPLIWMLFSKSFLKDSADLLFCSRFNFKFWIEFSFLIFSELIFFVSCLMVFFIFRIAPILLLIFESTFFFSILRSSRSKKSFLLRSSIIPSSFFLGSKDFSKVSIRLEHLSRFESTFDNVFSFFDKRSSMTGTSFLCSRFKVSIFLTKLLFRSL